MPDLELERGLRCLLERLGQDHPRYPEALVLEHRLHENLAQRRRYGDTETWRAERAQVVDALNELALDSLGISYNQLCRLDSLGEKGLKDFRLLQQAWSTCVQAKRPSEFRRWLQKGQLQQAIQLLSWACRNLGEAEYKVATQMLLTLTENKDTTPIGLSRAGKTLAPEIAAAKWVANVA